MAVVFCDTSVLLAAILEQHVHHARSVAVVRRLNRNTAACALHSLAEVYATLGQIPTGGPRPAPSDVRAAVADILRVFMPIALTTRDYNVVLDRLAASGIYGGRVYDALILQCAAKANASAVYTWNTKHFRALASPELLPLIREPELL